MEQILTPPEPKQLPSRPGFRSFLPARGLSDLLLAPVSSALFRPFLPPSRLGNVGFSNFAPLHLYLLLPKRRCLGSSKILLLQQELIDASPSGFVDRLKPAFLCNRGGANLVENE